MSRRGNWCQTFSGRQYWPLDPRPEEIFYEDVAHHLSLQCRFGGACREHYSVAEHSVRASYLVDSQHALQALLHDAAEAYVQDVVRPLKQHLADYSIIEKLNWEAVCKRFGIPLELHEQVILADEIMLVTEARDLMSKPPAPWKFARANLEPLKETITPWQPRFAKGRFLERFWELGGKELP